MFMTSNVVLERHQTKLVWGFQAARWTRQARQRHGLAMTRGMALVG